LLCHPDGREIPVSYRTDEDLNHSTGDIAEVYDRHDYLPEKQEALESGQRT